MKIIFSLLLFLTFNSLLLAKNLPQIEQKKQYYNIKPHFFSKNDKNISKIRLMANFSSEDIVGTYCISPMTERPAEKTKWALKPYILKRSLVFYLD